MNLIDTPTHSKPHKIRVWSIRERGIRINNSFQASPWSSFTMICYAECFNTLINIFKVFHEPLLKALFAIHWAFCILEGKDQFCPPKNQLMECPLQAGLAAQMKAPQTPTEAPNISHAPDEQPVLLKSKINWNKWCSLCDTWNRKHRWPQEIACNCSEESLPHSPS